MRSQCELCGTLYPDMIKHKGNQYQIFKFEVPTKCNYLTFEIVGMPAGKNFSVVIIPNN